MFWKYFIDGFFSCFGTTKHYNPTRNTYIENHFINISEHLAKSFEQVVGKYERN